MPTRVDGSIRRVAGSTGAAPSNPLTVARAESWAVSSGMAWGESNDRVAAMAVADSGATVVPICRTAPPRLMTSRLAMPMLTAVASAVLTLRPVVLAVAAAEPAIDPTPVTTESPGLLKNTALPGPERKRLLPSPSPRAVASEPIGCRAGSITRLLAWALGAMVSCRPPPRYVVPWSSCRATARDRAVVMGWNSMASNRRRDRNKREERGRIDRSGPHL